MTAGSCKEYRKLWVTHFEHNAIDLKALSAFFTLKGRGRPVPEEGTQTTLKSPCRLMIGKVFTIKNGSCYWFFITEKNTEVLLYICLFIMILEKKQHGRCWLIYEATRIHTPSFVSNFQKITTKLLMIEVNLGAIVIYY